MTTKASKIIYTKTDEAPALATYSFLPIVKAFTKAAGVSVELRDISLAGRILAVFPEHLTAQQKQSDDLAELGELAKTPEANIIKLPNISASIPQIKEAIKELQSQGTRFPIIPRIPRPTPRRTSRRGTTKSKGAPSTRCYVKATRIAGRRSRSSNIPDNTRTKWERGRLDSKTHVAHMKGGDFYSNEKSVTLTEATEARIEFVGQDGKTTVLKPKLSLQAGEVIDATFMSRRALREFLEEQIEDAQKQGVLFSHSHESHHDEGLGSQDLRPCGVGIFQGCVRQTWGRAPKTGCRSR